MEERKATSIRFESHVVPIKDYYSAIYGLKNLVSAGILLFARLDDAQKKGVILEVNKLPPEMAGMVDESAVIIIGAIIGGIALNGLGSIIDYLCTIAYHLNKIREDLQKNKNL